MIKIKKLYSTPETFNPVDFSSGINLIIGEPNLTSNKTNGVGKTLLVEFLNFCLLKDFKFSRLSRIPTRDFDPDTYICLDFEINNINYTVKRNIRSNNNPIIYYNNNKRVFDSLSDASLFLTNKLFQNEHESHPSFRSMLGPLIRDEGSEFKSIIDCYDTNLKIPPDLTPHLYLFGINIDIYHEVKKLISLIDGLTKQKNKLKRDIETISGVTFTKAKAELNELAAQVYSIKEEIDLLESNKSFEIIKDDILELELKIDELRNKKSILRSELNKINLLNGENYINDAEIVEIYNKFKEGLGDAIKKELYQVINFKKSIDSFQNKLLNDRKSFILNEIADISESSRSLNRIYSEKIKIFNQDGSLKNLKHLILSHQKKLEEKSTLSALLKKYEETDDEIKYCKSQKTQSILNLDWSIKSQIETIDEYQETISSMHEYIFSNHKCSFEIKTSDNKSVVNFNLRIDDDGSHSNEREKVFIYDISLLLTHKTYKKHPRLLIHDNIFDVDQDTLIRSLNFLAEKSSCLEDCQYILTLNSDKLSQIDKKHLKLDINEYKRISLTKNNRFLGRVYQQK